MTCNKILYDPEDEAIFQSRRWHISDTGYAVWRGISDGKKQTVRLHRLINDTPIGMYTDHINRNKLDNRRANLRTVTHRGNMQNKERGHGVWFHVQNHNWVVETMGEHIGCFAEEGLARQIASMVQSGELPPIRIKIVKDFCAYGHSLADAYNYGKGPSCRVCQSLKSKKYWRKKTCQVLALEG